MKLFIELLLVLAVTTSLVVIAFYLIGIKLDPVTAGIFYIIGANLNERTWKYYKDNI